MKRAAAACEGRGVSKKLREQMAKMTRLDYLTRIMELQQAVEAKDRRLAEAEATIERLRKLLAEARANTGKQNTSTDPKGEPRS